MPCTECGVVSAKFEVSKSFSFVYCTPIVFALFEKISFCSYRPIYRTLAFKGLKMM